MTIAATPDSDDKECLYAAFQSFDEAARTLQQSYSVLTARVEQVDLELAQSNDALRRQLHDNEAMRAHLDGILESLSTGVLVLDDAGIISRSNLSAARVLGLTDDELCGRHVASVLEDLELGLGDRPQRIGQAMVTITRAPLKASSRSCAGSLVLIQDITQVYQLEEQLQRKDRLAAMGEMIGRIAHEIRNPLGSVEIFSSLLRRDLEDRPSAKLYTEQISEAVQAMDRLLANLLAYTKPVRPFRAWHPAEPLILDSLSLAAHAITKVPVDIRLDLDPSIPEIWCHEGRMKQVVLNLIINAVQAMPNGGVLTISLKADQAQTLGVSAIRLTVRDSGAGIDPAFRSRLFDPFFTTKDDGTGLGLAIVYSIVEAHEGRIDVESVVGRGAVFSIVLPHPLEGARLKEGEVLGSERQVTSESEPSAPACMEDRLYE